MDKKIRLGLNLFFSNASNSGIVNYIYNIICALKTLPEKQKPAIIVFHSENAPVDYLKEINYPGITFILFKPYSSFKAINRFNKIIFRLTQRNLYYQFRYLNKIDILYPYFEFIDKGFEGFSHKIHWLVDFNNRAYPDHYADKGQSMQLFQENLTQRTDHIVLSSQSLLEELKLYYPDYKNKVSVLRFASTLPALDNLNSEKLLEKYELKSPYFMSPNQFWEHKNQLLLIEALNILKQSGKLNFQTVFTGSMEVNRGKGHMLSKLLEAIKKYELEDCVKFLGIIDRHEQLVLMKNAAGLIQPSLYEGWSTLVEEAKALNQKIVLSDLPVHREQHCVNSYFFNPYSAAELAAQIIFCKESAARNEINYSENVIAFGKEISKVLTNELKKKSKILIISHDASRTGAPILLLNLAKVLHQHYQIDFLLKKGGELEERFKKYGLCKIAANKNANTFLNKVKRKLLNNKVTFNLSGLQWSSYDFIFSNTLTNGDILPLIRKKFKGVIISYIHELSTAAHFFTNQKNVNEVITASDKFLVPSAAVQNFLIRHYTIAPDKIKLMPYYIPAQKNVAEKAANAKFIVGGAGYIDWRKGCDLFILIALEVFNAEPEADIQFVWRGAQLGIELEKLQYDIDKTGLTNKVKFLPAVDDLSDFYNALSVFLLTSREDPYPLVVLEAASMSVPTICFADAGGSQEFINSCNGGVCIKYLDLKGIATAVLNYYHNKSQFKDAGVRAKKKLECTHQNPSNILSKFEDILNDAL